MGKLLNINPNFTRYNISNNINFRNLLEINLSVKGTRGERCPYISGNFLNNS